MALVGSGACFDAFRALADRCGRPGEQLIKALAAARAGTADNPEFRAPAVAAGIGLPAAAPLGLARYYADLATPLGRRSVRVCAATAYFSAPGGRHLTDVESELGGTGATVSPDGETSVQAVRCLGYRHTGRHGRARLTARISEQTAPGRVFCSFHFPTNGVNRLTSGHADTVTCCPEYNVTAVRVATP
ncbi:NAD(P)H-dependent oxidoreductase subunit E [Streptomyces sp. NPDC059175]|uniref:NAD(P)H-dependent oxidoreductase subunit E n=1 Tax=Streptomyces sp. NPDC059175 TaxID=3346757 RepID=UPI00368C99F0